MGNARPSNLTFKSTCEETLRRARVCEERLTRILCGEEATTTRCADMGGMEEDSLTLRKMDGLGHLARVDPNMPPHKYKVLGWYT